MIINISSRLHFSLISLHENGYRRNGGFGFAIEEPSLRIRSEESSEFFIIDHRERGFGDSEIKRLIEILRQTAERMNFTRRCSIEIAGDVASHTGFGTGTAIRLASLELLYLINEVDYTEEEIINASGRGGTSGIGIRTYFSGGYVFDIGRSDTKGTFLPSCAAENESSLPLTFLQEPMPDWEIGLCIPHHIHPKTEIEEKEFFRKICPIEPVESYETLYHVVYGLIGGVKENNKTAFGQALKNLQSCRWKQAERQLYNGEIESVEKALYDAGADAVGMSSLGPTLFFLANNVSEVIQNAQIELPECTLIVTRPQNSGRTIIHD